MSPARNQRCPCGSRRLFRNCCIVKRFRWESDGEGGWDRIVPLTEEAIDAFDQMKEQFIQVFGREPGPDDHVSPLAYVTDSESMIDEWVKAGKKVGADPALLYATRRTGLIVVEGYTDLVPEQRLREWEAAVREYQLLQHEALEGLDALTEELKEEYERLPYMLGLIVHHAATPQPIDVGSLAEFQETFLFFCTAKTGKTVRAIRHLVEDNLGEDALNLVRAVYENYLYMMYSIVAPAALRELLVARLGIAKGTHRYATAKSGKQNRRLIVELNTGRQFRADITTAGIAGMSPFPADLAIHSFLYSFLSGYTHPHVLTLSNYIDPEESRFSITSRNMVMDAFLLGLVAVSMVLDSALQSRCVPVQARSDVRQFIARLREKLIKTLEVGSGIFSADTIRERVLSLGEPWPQPTGEAAPV
jgi:hypothetical protein